MLDPSVFPGTGTPEAGGVSFKELLDAIIKVCEGCNVIGCDVNELSPHYDQSGVSTAVAGKIAVSYTHLDVYKRQKVYILLTGFIRHRWKKIIVLNVL